MHVLSTLCSIRLRLLNNSRLVLVPATNLIVSVYNLFVGTLDQLYKDPKLSFRLQTIQIVCLTINTYLGRLLKETIVSIDKHGYYEANNNSIIN